MIIQIKNSFRVIFLFLNSPQLLGRGRNLEKARKQRTNILVKIQITVESLLLALAHFNVL
jgi:hypothetical protein